MLFVKRNLSPASKYEVLCCKGDPFKIKFSGGQNRLVPFLDPGAPGFFFRHSMRTPHVVSNGDINPDILMVEPFNPGWLRFGIHGPPTVESEGL